MTVRGYVIVKKYRFACIGIRERKGELSEMV